jgi:hypothetical protein
LSICFEGLELDDMTGRLARRPRLDGPSASCRIRPIPVGL